MSKNDIPETKECVVLLHGITLNKYTMYFLKKHLERQGYNTLPITYPSRKMTLDELSGWLRDSFLTANFWDSQLKVHFVTHSMGGLLARRYLSRYQDRLPAEKIGRVVMIGTPNKGSEAADALKDFGVYKWGFGPAGAELTTSVQEGVSDPVYFDTGIIAGTCEWWADPLSVIFFKDANDGKVSVERSKLDGMKDHLVVQSSHTAMLYRPSIWAQTSHFLKHGVFNHGS